MGKKECRVKKQGIVQLHIVENKETQLYSQEWKAFVNFGPRLPLEENMRIFYNEDLAKTVLTLDKSDPGTITFTTTLPGKFVKTEYKYRNRFKLCESGKMRVLTMDCPVSGTPRAVDMLEYSGSGVRPLLSEEKAGIGCD